MPSLNQIRNPSEELFSFEEFLLTGFDMKNAAATATGAEKDLNGTGVAATDAAAARRPYDYGGNPLAHIATNDPSLRLAAFGGEFQPGLYRAPKKGIANPAPLGLSAFALTTFVLSLINVGARDTYGQASLVLAIALGYGGLVQLLAGMWEMAVGNTFGATALSSYGGFWISFGILFTPSFGIADSLGGATSPVFYNSVGFYLMVGERLGISWNLLFRANLYAGLVHLHFHPARVHAPINARLFHALLHSGPGIPAPRHWLAHKW